VCISDNAHGENRNESIAAITCPSSRFYGQVDSICCHSTAYSRLYLSDLALLRIALLLVPSFCTTFGSQWTQLGPKFLSRSSLKQRTAINIRVMEQSRYTAKRGAAFLTLQCLPQRRMSCPFAGREDPFPKRPVSRPILQLCLLAMFGRGHPRLYGRGEYPVCAFCAGASNA